MELEASIVGSAQTGPVDISNISQDHNLRPHNEETNEAGSQDGHDYDEDDEGGFGVDVGSHL